jgi:fucose 4-O-acetylase-like acetyltransferase
MQFCHHSEVFSFFKMELEILCNLNKLKAGHSLVHMCLFIGSCYWFYICYICSAFLYDCLLFLNQSMKQLKSVVVVMIKGFHVLIIALTKLRLSQLPICSRTFRYSVGSFFLLLFQPPNTT